MPKDEAKVEVAGWRQHLLLSLAVGVGIPLVALLLNPWLALGTLLTPLVIAGLYAYTRRQHPERKLNWLIFLTLIAEFDCIVIGSHWMFSDESYMNMLFIILGITGTLSIPLNLFEQTRPASTLRWVGAAITLMVVITVTEAFLTLYFSHTSWGSSLLSLAYAVWLLIAVPLIVILRRQMGDKGNNSDPSATKLKEPTLLLQQQRFAQQVNDWRAKQKQEV